MDERKIQWLASYPKSGSTWVRMFLNAYISGFPISLNSGFQYAYGDNNLGFFQSVSCRPANALTATEQVLLRPAALMFALNMSATENICLKTHHAKVTVDGIPLFSPKISAGGIYIVRDPRDIVISFADHVGAEIDTTISNMNNIQYVNEHKTSRLMHIITTWSKHVETWIDKNNDIPMKVIKYEDMLKRPRYEFTRILESLDFNDIDSDRFDFALKQTTFKALREFEDKIGFRERGCGEKFFRVGKAGQWHTGLSEAQVFQIEQDHGIMMERLGYKLTATSHQEPVTKNQEPVTKNQ